MPTGFARLLLYLLSGGLVAGSAAVAAWGLNRFGSEVNLPPPVAGRQVPATATEADAGEETSADTASRWTTSEVTWAQRAFQGPLFDSPPVAPPPPPPPVPPPLVLRGTVAEGGPESRAFLAGRDGALQVLRIGDEMEGAELVSVEADHAVVRFQDLEHRLELTP